MLQTIRDYLETNSVVPPQYQDLDKPAAVLIPLTNDSLEPSVILTRRAQHLSTHSGEVSLPGGKWEPQDQSLAQTALRETHEEIGLCPSLVELLGTLPMFQTWRGVSVVPYVGVVPSDVALVANEGELDAIFQVPVSFFLQDERIRTDVFERSVGHSWSPAYQFGPYEIWGFTAKVLSSFFSKAFDLNIQRQADAPVKDWAKINATIAEISD